MGRLLFIFLPVFERRLSCLVGPEAAGQAWEGVVIGGMAGKDHPATHVPARKSSPKGWVGWDKKKMVSTPFGGFLSDIGEG